MRARFLVVFGSVCAIGLAMWWYLSRPLRTPPLADLAELREELRRISPEETNDVVEQTPRPINLEKLSPHVRHVLDGEVSIQERYVNASALVPDLTQDDLNALAAVLRQRSKDDEHLVGQSFKNAIMDRLCDLNPPGLTRLLTQVFQDRTQDVVIRDYALQHVIEYYERRTDASGADTSESEWKRLAEILWAAVEEADSSIAGTALLGLLRLSETHSLFDRERVAVVACQVIESRTASQYTRITAIQVSAELGDTNALPLIWQAAAEGENLPVQISAIGALGIYGNADAKPFLKMILDGEAGYLKPAASRALRRITMLEKQRAKELYDQQEAEEWRRRNANKKPTAFVSEPA